MQNWRTLKSDFLWLNNLKERMWRYLCLSRVVWRIILLILSPECIRRLVILHVLLATFIRFKEVALRSRKRGEAFPSTKGGILVVFPAWSSSLYILTKYVRKSICFCEWKSFLSSPQVLLKQKCFTLFKLSYVKFLKLGIWEVEILVGRGLYLLLI